MLEVVRLVKKFGPLVAVDDISFTVKPGEVVGLTGPNGSGKSTAIRIIAGFLMPSAGTAIVCGHDILARPLAAKRQIGYLPEGAPAYPDMTAAGFLRFIARIRGLGGAAARERVARVVELLHIGAAMHRPIGMLSRGVRRRVGMAQALLHDPGVVILDEPTDGLDPNQTREIQGIIRAIGSEKAVVVSTHALQDVEAVCSRAIIVGRGRILAGGTIAELASRSRYHNAVRLGIPNGSDPGIEAELSHLPGVRLIEPASDGDGEGWWLFPWQSRPIIDDVAALVRARRWPVTCLRAEHGRLEDVFPALTMPAQRIAAESPREPAAHGTGRLISR